MIAILDYSLGNLGSIANMLKVIGEKSKITSNRNGTKRERNQHPLTPQS